MSGHMLPYANPKAVALPCWHMFSGIVTQQQAGFELAGVLHCYIAQCKWVAHAASAGYNTCETCNTHKNRQDSTL